MAEQFDEFDDFIVAEDTIEIENMVTNTIFAKHFFNTSRTQCYTE